MMEALAPLVVGVVIGSVITAAIAANNKYKISPELEILINKVSAAATKIDQKVPDKNVPPGSTTPKKGYPL